jgi:hypothetical protein
MSAKSSDDRHTLPHRLCLSPRPPRTSLRSPRPSSTSTPTNPQYSLPFPHSPNYFSRFYSAKSHVKPPRHPKNPQPQPYQQDKTFPKVIFSYTQSCKIELEEPNKRRPGHQAGPNSFVWNILAVTPMNAIFWQPESAKPLQANNLRQDTPGGGTPQKGAKHDPQL